MTGLDQHRSPLRARQSWGERMRWVPSPPAAPCQHPTVFRLTSFPPHTPPFLLLLLLLLVLVLFKASRHEDSRPLHARACCTPRGRCASEHHCTVHRGDVGRGYGQGVPVLGAQRQKKEVLGASITRCPSRRGGPVPCATARAVPVASAYVGTSAHNCLKPTFFGCFCFFLVNKNHASKALRVSLLSSPIACSYRERMDERFSVSCWELKLGHLSQERFWSIFPRALGKNLGHFPHGRGLAPSLQRGAALS